MVGCAVKDSTPQRRQRPRLGYAAPYSCTLHISYSTELGGGGIAICV